MKRIFLSVLLISAFYQISNAKEDLVKDKGDNVSTEEKSEVKAKQVDKTSKKQDDAKSSKEKDVKIATTQEEEKDQNKAKDEIPHYKGKWKYAAKSQMSIYFNDGQRISQFSPYALGFSYRFLDQLKIATYIGIGVQYLNNGNEYTELQDYGWAKSKYTYHYDIYPFFVPIDVTLAYSLTNFKKVGKNAEIVVGVGYDIGFVPSGGFKIGNNKFRLEAGVQLGRTLGFRFSYIPSVQNGKTASETSSFYGTSIVFAWKN